MRHVCSKCSKDCGMQEQPALYVFKGEDICGPCLKTIAPYWKSEVDRACVESDSFQKRVKSGDYMKERKDILGYGKKNKE